MLEVTRRRLMGALGAMGAAAAAPAVIAASSAHADESQRNTGGWTGTPEEVKALGGCTMPLEELNRRRAEYVDSQTEYVKSDGTVVPVEYVKMHAIINTYNSGIGNALNDNSFDAMLDEVSPEEARAYVAMPRGVKFRAIDFAATSDYTVEEATDYCNSLARKHWIRRAKNDDGWYYTQLPYAQGIAELHVTEVVNEGRNIAGLMTNDVEDMVNSYMGGQSFLIPVPVNADVVQGNELPLYDDIVALINSKDKFSLAPCTCRAKKMAKANGDFPGCGSSSLEGLMSSVCGHRIETCLSMGEEAQFWIDQGVAREITKEEALEVLQRSIDDGFVLQKINSRNVETICSCQGDCCNVLGMWKAMDEMGLDMFESFHNCVESRYSLDVDLDACLKCGACAERCPLDAITMDEETGYPTVAQLCMRCGQCAYVCPAQARTIVPGEGEVFIPGDNILEMDNELAADRFERGLIF